MSCSPGDEMNAHLLVPARAAAPMSRARMAAAGRRFLILGVPVVALCMLLTMLIPAGHWRAPAVDAEYHGFDTNLIFTSESGPAPSGGIVHVSTGSVQLVALPESMPILHLVTSPLSFAATMDVRIIEGDGPISPLRIGIWSPRTRSGYFVNFSGSPVNAVTAETVGDGTVGQTLAGGTVLKRDSLGRYWPGERYRLELAVDRQRGTFHSRLTSHALLASAHPGLSLLGGPADRNYSDVVSDFVPVEGDAQYDFGGTVRLASGSDAYKVSIGWYDAAQAFLTFSNDWRSVRELAGWTPRMFHATAPPNAAFARVFLGSGNETRVVYADLFLRERVNPSRNLLPTGDFHQGLGGWTLVDSGARAPVIIDPDPAVREAWGGTQLVPDLFPASRLPLSLTVSLAARSGISRAVLEHYTLALPHQRWLTTKVDDPRARQIVAMLLAVGMLLVGIRLVLWVGARGTQPGAAGDLGRALDRDSSSSVRTNRKRIAVVAGFLLVQAWLFHLGSLPFDMQSAKVWAYVAARHGPLDLYHLPNIVSLARVWNGVPFHEAIFPYGPPMAYLFTLIGWLDRLFLSGPAGFILDTFMLEFLIKAFNVLFALGCGVLIYLVLRGRGLGEGAAKLSGALFLFNPAIWFSMSVWGQTQTVTLCLVLASIWAAENDRPACAWFALAVTGLTRPQILVPACLLGICYLQRFPLRRNVSAIAWATVLLFLFLGPFLLEISPSLPVDYYRSIFSIQGLGGNEPAMTLVSLGAYSVWPLVVHLVSRASGLATFNSSSAVPLIGRYSYDAVSTVVTLGLVLVVASLLLRRRRSAPGRGSDFLVLAGGTMGFLMLKTGVAGAHFVLALPFLILCMQAVGPRAASVLVGVWTLTTFVAMYGNLGFGISNVPYLAPAIAPGANALTRFFMSLHSADWFITLSVAANVLVLVWLLAQAAVGGQRRPSGFDVGDVGEMAPRAAGS
jgi:hypothetical protein